MAERARAVNPKVLRWARERSGRSVEEVARTLKKDASVIESWETGRLYPTVGQLEKLAYQLYKRPLAIFFFPEPPEEETPDQEFRTLPEFETENLAPDSLYAVREARAMQDSLRQLTERENPAESLIFEQIRPDDTGEVHEMARRARVHLGISLDAQTRWSTTEDAFKNWRSALEHNGVFVFKRAFKQSDISAFCLFDRVFPIIYINNSTTFSRQCFSLFHELAHILFETSGITKADIGYIEILTGNNREIEIACNKFAAEFLVPSSDFLRRASGYEGDEHEIEIFAERYGVSREVIFRQLLEAGVVSEDEYRARAAAWNAEFFARSQERQGGNYYATKAAYLGDSFINLAFAQYNTGRCSIDELASHLNMKARNVQNLETFVHRLA